MNNQFIYSNDNKRYHTLSYHLKQKFGERVFKAVINAGFTCPNIDGKCSTGGCTYCTSGGSEFSGDKNLSITKQIADERERIHKKYKDAKIIAYFQANTNTYAPLERLKALYEEALSQPYVLGLSIATRADCLDDDILDYLEELSKRTYLTVELGLQTVYDETAKRINRGHSFECFKDSFIKLKQRNIRTVVHLINGLPDETLDMMINSAKVVGKLKPDGVKIHLLHIMENTRMYEEYKCSLVKEMSFDDYIKTICTQLTYFPNETVIERLTGDGSKAHLIAPLWSKDKIRVLGTIDKYMADNNLVQGLSLNDQH